MPSHHVGPTTDFEPFPREVLERSIPDRFEEIVRRYPDRLAVKAGSHALTYDALNRAANRVARAILAHGGGEEEPIAILLEKGALRIDAILGVLKGGKIYVPLDPAFPPERLRSLLGDSQAGLIVTHRTNLSLGSALARNAIPLLDTDGLDAGLSAENLGGSIHPDTIAYIMYTSGSTGRPKGVVQTHRTVLHAIMTHTDSLRICVDDRLSHVYSYSFSAATKSVFGALLNGAAVFPFDFQQEGLTGLAAWLTREEITIFHSVTSLFRHFAGSLTDAERFPRLRMIYVGGEAVTRRDVDLYKAHFSAECTFLVRLAITEAGAVRHYPIDRTTPVIEDVVPVGYAVPDKEVLLLDAAGNAVGANGIGEIAMRSPFLAPGYWGQPDLTRGAFLPDPAGGNARIYRTGDLGRLLPDGRLEHLGRKDFQVKIRGLRADVAAIEAALLDGASLKEAAVLPREDASGDTRLIAYVVPAPGYAPTGSDLRNALRGKLPDHMIPSAFVVMDALPLLPSGKADRRALPDPEPTRGETEAAPVAPRDPLELQLTQLWEKVLGVRPVGVRDDFFELGGDSLLAARLLADVAKLSGRQLPLGIMFRAPTVEQLAGLLRQNEPAAPRPALVAVQSGGSKPPLFCLHQHTGHIFWTHELARLLGPDQPVYGFEARGLDGLQAPPTRIENMAAEYVQELRALQPEGPYLLSGYCFGGTVAFEMAQQLHAQGQAVALLALIQSVPPDHTPGVRRGLHRMRQRFDFEWARLSRLTVRGKAAYLLGKAAGVLRDQGGRVLTGTRNRIRRGLGRESYLDRAIRRVERALIEAKRRYVPRAYPGRIVLFRSVTLPARYHRDPHLGWSGLAAGGVEIHEVPGTRPTILEEPDVRILADRLRAFLQAAQAAGAGARQAGGATSDG